MKNAKAIKVLDKVQVFFYLADKNKNSQNHQSASNLEDVLVVLDWLHYLPFQCSILKKDENSNKQIKLEWTWLMAQIKVVSWWNLN